jgi:hypothetical protein
MSIAWAIFNSGRLLTNIFGWIFYVSVKARMIGGHGSAVYHNLGTRDYFYTVFSYLCFYDSVDESTSADHRTMSLCTLNENYTVIH